jgi:outer membrane autotransporter protein
MSLWDLPGDQNSPTIFTADPFASDDQLPDYVSGYSPKPAQISALAGWRSWVAVFAGRSDLAGDPKTGTQDVVAGVTGTAFGMDKQFGETDLAGGSVTLSQQTFSSGPGHGRSRDLTFTLYGRYSPLEHVYLTGALGYGWHNIEPSRTVPPFDVGALTAKYQAQDVGGRLEGGYSFTLNDGTMLSPYGAFVGDAFHQPSYAEKGFPLFAASFAATTLAVTHLELGSRFAHFFVLEDGDKLSIDAVAAWERELDDNPYVLAAFRTAPDSKFAIYGTKPANNTALLGMGLRFQSQHGFSIGARSDARLGPRTTILSANADLTYQW